MEERSKRVRLETHRARNIEIWRTVSCRTKLVPATGGGECETGFAFAWSIA